MAIGLYGCFPPSCIDLAWARLVSEVLGEPRIRSQLQAKMRLYMRIIIQNLGEWYVQ